jgi:molecular chaperone GrpE
MARRSKKKGTSEDKEGMQTEKDQLVAEEPQESVNQDAQSAGGTDTTEKDPMVELQGKYDELNDRFLRLFSEFDNYKKRTAKERLELLGSARGESMQSLLPIIDDFERAIQNNESVEDASALKEGFGLIHSKLKGILDQNGLRPIETGQGDDFDTDIHEAITRIPAPEESLKGKVVDVIEKGYKLNEKVLRFAKVVIGS